MQAEMLGLIGGAATTRGADAQALANRLSTNRILHWARTMACACAFVLAAPVAVAQLANSASYHYGDVVVPTDIYQIDGAGFGTVLTSGDFNCDGLDDLASGLPWWSYYDYDALEYRFEAGMVAILFGDSYYGLFGGDGLFQGLNQMQGTPEVGDRFGYALASGDFNADGCDDLAIGAPWETVSGIHNHAGQVMVVYGYEFILSYGVSQTFTQNDDGVLGVSEEGDAFGYSVAAGDFDGDGIDDLVVGVPDEDIVADGVSLGDAGCVQVFRGTTAGISVIGDVLICSGDHGMPEATAGAGFGHSVALGDVDPQRSGEELVVSQPGRAVNGRDNAGMISVIFGDAQTNPESLSFTQDSDHVVGIAEGGDYFGWSLAVDDFDNDSYAEVVASAPYEDAGDPVLEDVGMVIVINLGSAQVASKAWLRSDLPNLDESDHAQGAFGWSLASGDIDDDGYSDLAIGAPDQASVRPGAAFVLFGDDDSLLSGRRAQRVDAACTHCNGGIQFGNAVAIGRFGSIMGLVVGAPGWVSYSTTYPFYSYQLGMVAYVRSDTLFRNGFD